MIYLPRDVLLLTVYRIIEEWQNVENPADLQHFPSPNHSSPAHRNQQTTPPRSVSPSLDPYSFQSQPRRPVTPPNPSPPHSSQASYSNGASTPRPRQTAQMQRAPADSNHRTPAPLRPSSGQRLPTPGPSAPRRNPSRSARYTDQEYRDDPGRVCFSEFE